MNLGIIGCGAIGSDVAKAADSFQEREGVVTLESRCVTRGDAARRR